LNTIGISISEWEIYAVTIAGIISQLGVLAFDAVVTYYWRWEKGGRLIPTYAYPLTLLGTLGVVMGMYICAYIIESSTKELEWQPNATAGTQKIPRRRILWVQKSQTVGDQGFKSFVLYAPFTDGSSPRSLMTSQRQPASTFHNLTLIATVLSLGGMYS